jgi:hypothetical protein
VVAEAIDAFLQRISAKGALDAQLVPAANA